AATSTAGSVWGTAGFTPVGTAGTAFTGTFSGASHVISNLAINRPGLDNTGLFGMTGTGASISDLGLAGGSISGNNNVGAIAGSNAGGLVGDNTGGAIANSYASGNVTGNNGSAIGGLVGENTGGTINTSYSTGVVAGSSGTGGLVGSGTGTVSDSYWDTQTSTKATSAGGTGKTTAQMKQAATFAGWSMATTGGSGNVWRMYEGQTGPLLRSFLTTLTVADATPVTYSASVRNGTAIATSGGKTATAASGTNAGTYTAWSNQQGYDIIGGLLLINSFAVNLSGTRVYDGSTSVAAGSMTFGALVAGQTLTLSGTGTIADKNVGTGKSVTGFALGNGTGLASNYTLAGGTQEVSVTPKALTYTTSAANKTYDGTVSTAATVTLAGLVDSETLGVTASATFNSKNVASANLVTVNSVTLSNGSNGGVASNYTIAGGGTAAASISQASLAVTGIGALNKTYDATTAATLFGTASVTALGADVVNVGGSGTGVFANKNVGIGKAVTVTGYTLSGTDAANYAIVQPAAVTANIAQANLAVTGISAQNKVYDTSVAAILTGTATVAALGGDVVNVTGVGAGGFADKNAGNNKGVTVTGFSLSGTDALNYNLIQPQGLTANISQASLVVSGVTVQNKVYDATTAAALGGSAVLAAALGSDVVNLAGTGTGAFANKNVGNGKAVTVTGYSLTGTDAANYAIVQPASLTANISQASLAVTGITAQNKVYDASVTASLAGTATVTALGGDVVNVTGTGAGVFADKNAANGKAVTVTGFTLSGTDALNYNLIQPQGLSANIGQASLAVTGIGAANKTYDATAAAALFGTATVTALGGDIVNLAGTGTGVF
ncbi:MAG: YDG domain-containing protein, partial [Pseudoxanthomonas sp.]